MIRRYPLYKTAPMVATVLAAMCLAVLCTLATTCSGQPGSTPVTTIKPTIIRTIPHDSMAFTQGLIHDNGRLYESTGAPGGHQSSIRIIDAASGTILGSRVIPGVFAEGLARMGNRALQLTWRDRVVFSYSFPSFSQTGSFTIPEEGWGLTNTKDLWIMSTGSDTLLFRDNTFAIKRRLPVTYRGKPLASLNELEFARGMIYANVWHSDDIFEIDPRTGRVTRVIDCSELVSRAAPPTSEEVLNGIAFNESTGAFYLTGKDWKLVFEVRIGEK